LRVFGSYGAGGEFLGEVGEDAAGVEMWPSSDVGDGPAAGFAAARKSRT